MSNSSDCIALEEGVRRSKKIALPNTYFACLPTEWVVQTLNRTVCPLNRWCGYRTWLFAPNGWCSHRTWLFVHRTGGAITAHRCSHTERVVPSLHMAVRPPNVWCGHHPHRAVRPPNGWCRHRTIIERKQCGNSSRCT